MKTVTDMETALDRDTQGLIRFTNFLIFEFASAYKMPVADAYKYLKEYGGIDFLYRHWWALHTDNPLYAIRDLLIVCHNNGGELI
jgi:hypothetical protein